MFNNHTMSMVTDLNIIGNQINNSDFVTVAALTDQPINHPNVYNASILVPPLEILMRWADGDALVIQNEYPKYLMTKDPDDMIVALLAALTKKNVVLYCPFSEFGIFGQMLLNHLYYVYGIVCNFNGTKFYSDPTKIPFIMSKFYMMGLIEPMDYLEMYPSNAPLPEFAIHKLAADLRPFKQPATFMEYANYFNQLNINSGNNPKNKMASVVIKEPK